jgi:hypothetical protein
MQLDAIDHFYQIVTPAIRAYEAAEDQLTRAVVDNQSEEPLATAAGFEALREGGAAAIYLHHFADIIAARGHPAGPDFGGDVRAARSWLAEVCEATHGEDLVGLLEDVADALKHSVLTRRLPREVEEAGQVLTICRGFGTGRYGEGKYGGVDEVWILGREGPRPLSLVLDRVSTAWATTFP